MKDKTKEILEQSLDYEFDLTFKQRKELLDYIINLQDTLKDREEYCYGLETQITNLQEENKNLKLSLKDRLKYSDELDEKIEIIDKAKDLLNNENIIVKLQEFENKYTVNFYDKKVELLSILLGDDSDE